jgi:hypothetical protein
VTFVRYKIIRGSQPLSLRALLGQEDSPHMPVHIGQPAVHAIVEHGGVDVVHLGGMGAVEGLEAERVAFPVDHATLDATADEPVGEEPDRFVLITIERAGA